MAHTYHPSMPFIAHKRLSNVTTPVPHNQVRKTVISNTLDRIHYKPRSHQSYDPMEDFLNERSVVSFEDVTRSIRANTAALLKKVHTPIPRAIKPLSVSNLYNHTETPISERISSDEYIWHLLRPLPGKASNGIDVGYYPESSTKIPLGKTHLACLSYAGGHPISKRRNLVAGPGDEYRNVRNDVELLSYYTKMRQAANLPHENGETVNAEDGRFKYASTTPHTTNEVISNGPTALDEEKENIKKNSLKKKLSKDSSIDEDRLKDQVLKKAEEERLAEQRAEEERLEREHLVEEERLEKERLAEEERLEQERLAEEKRLEEERLVEEKRLEEERLEQKRLAEEERLEQERLIAEREAEEARKEEEQRLLEEKLVQEYHREQERLAEEQRRLEQQYAEEQQRLAQEKLAEEQRLLHEKLLEIQQQQEAEEAENEEESSKVEVEEKIEDESDYVTCDNEIKHSGEVEIEEIKKDESGEEFEESDEEPAIAENVEKNGSVEIEEVVEVNYSFKSTTEISGNNIIKAKSYEEEDDEKSENTDVNSEISEAEEEPNAINGSTNVESEITESKENEDESEEEEEESEEDEEEE